MKKISINVDRRTHRRLILLKSQLGALHVERGLPSLDAVINLALDAYVKETGLADIAEQDGKDSHE